VQDGRSVVIGDEAPGGSCQGWRRGTTVFAPSIEQESVSIQSENQTLASITFQ